MEDLQAPFARWGKSTGSLRRHIDRHVEVIVHSEPWDEPTTLLETRVFGQFAGIMSTVLTNRAFCLPQGMIGELLAADSEFRTMYFKVT